MRCNWFTYVLIFAVAAFVIYVYCSKAPPTQEGLTYWSTTDAAPVCYGQSERECVNTPGCEWTIDNNYYGSCQPKTVWYNPWSSGLYNWYDRYWSPSRWYYYDYPYYSYSYYRYPWRYRRHGRRRFSGRRYGSGRRRAGRRRMSRGGRRGGIRRGGRRGGGRRGGGRRGGGGRRR